MAYNPNQPRNPAGSPGGGEFAGGGGTGGSKPQNLTSVAATAKATGSSPTDPPAFGKKGGKGNPINANEGSRPGSDTKEYRDNLEKNTRPLTTAEHLAVREFTGGDYSAMRAEDEAGGSDRTRELYSAMEKLPRYDGTMYRGIAAVEPEKYGKLLESKEFTLDSVSSFSRAERIGVEFSNRMAGSRNVVFKVQSKTGRSAEHVSEYSDEREVIAGKGTTYRVSKKYYAMYKTNVVYPTLVIEAQEV